MEHFRRWGLAERIREVAPLKVDWSQDVVFCTTLARPRGDALHRLFGAFAAAHRAVRGGGTADRPAPGRGGAAGGSRDLESCQLCLGWSLHALEQHDDGVQATIVNEQGEQRQIEGILRSGL